MNEFLMGELFCGPGGLALGAKNALLKETSSKIIHAWASDYDADTCKTFARNICPDSPEKVICSDVRNLDIKSLAPIDIFAYGFPCNDFSIVGEKKGFDGHFGPLYTYGIEVLNHFKPKAFLAENVGGLTSANEGKAFKKICDDLRSAGNGYVLTPHLYKFEEYGVPQTRHRVIIVGIDKTLHTKFRVPAPLTALQYVSARSAIENPVISERAFNHEATRQSGDVVERLRYIKPGQNAWTADIPKHLQLNVKSARMSQIYKRLDPDKPSYTITGSGGGGTHGYHWDEPRALTNRERARIQTFPDDFIFEGSKESVRKQIGMAVPPRFSEVIFCAILKALAGIESAYISNNIDHSMFSEEASEWDEKIRKVS